PRRWRGRGSDGHPIEAGGDDATTHRTGGGDGHGGALRGRPRRGRAALGPEVPLTASARYRGRLPGACTNGSRANLTRSTSMTRVTASGFRHGNGLPVYLCAVSSFTSNFGSGRRSTTRPRICAST